MVTPFTTKWHTSFSSMKPFEADTESKMLGCWALLFRATDPTV